ncbi:hypothetical protein [Lactiplantibacillus plantarum]|uniref:hypothetical protein n=1 Tax=Lactiplantibacillus plantarum TaxID=1590 RepID=UPI00402B7136
MELTIKGTPEEIKSVFQAISGSKEHDVDTKINQLVNLLKACKQVYPRSSLPLET